MFLLGIRKSVEFLRQTQRLIGVGPVDIVASMSAEQVGWAQAALRTFRFTPREASDIESGPGDDAKL